MKEKKILTNGRNTWQSWSDDIFFLWALWINKKKLPRPSPTYGAFVKQLKSFKRVAGLEAYSSVALKALLCPILLTTLVFLFKGVLFV